MTEESNPVMLSTALGHVLPDAEHTAEADLVAALGALSDPPKEGKVAAGQRRYAYLTLVDLLQAVRPVFAAHNLAITQDVETREHGVSVVTVIRHTSGQVFESSALVLTCHPDPQSVGSAITYARRYQLGAMVGLAGDDDDGQAAAHTPPRNSKETQPPWTAAPRVHPPEPPPALRPMPPATPVPAPDATSPSAQRLATPDQIKRMWVELGKTQWDKDQIRDWVNRTLDLGTLDWHSKDLLGWQVSELIHRLQPPAFDPGPDRPRR